MELHSWSGGFHNFEIFAPDAGMSRTCLATRTDYLRRALYAFAHSSRTPVGEAHE
jgi:hypothetical protein